MNNNDSGNRNTHPGNLRKFSKAGERFVDPGSKEWQIVEQQLDGSWLLKRLFYVFATIVLVTLTILFLEGFHVYGFDLPDLAINGIAVALITESAVTVVGIGRLVFIQRS